MNILVHITGGGASSINGKSESPNKTLENIKKSIFVNYIHKTELQCRSYQYYVWVVRTAGNMLY